jgi:nitrogen fixation NifU-like protein
VNEALRRLYQEVILDHSRAPRRRGPLPGATHEGSLDNPLCGDRVTLRLVVEAGAIRDVAFEAQGCNLSIAAASLLASRLAGVPLAQARALVARFESFATAPPGSPMPADLGDLAAFAGVREFRSRQACATLAALAFLRAVGG